MRCTLAQEGFKRDIPTTKAVVSLFVFATVAVGIFFSFNTFQSCGDLFCKNVASEGLPSNVTGHSISLMGELKSKLARRDGLLILYSTDCSACKKVDKSLLIAIAKSRNLTPLLLGSSGGGALSSSRSAPQNLV